MAAYFTALGALFVPIGVVVMVEWPNWDSLAFMLIVAGLICAIAGLAFTVRDKREDAIKEQKEEQRKQSEEQRRQEEHIEYLTKLRVIAKQVGATSVNTRRR